jgi:nicotinate-nucleotide pyrophosphorylase (carboxylating)
MSTLDDVPVDLRAELTAAGLDVDAVWETIRRAVAEDLPDGSGTDPTSWATIDEDARGEAVLAAREDGVVAGLGVAAVVFHALLGDEAVVTDRLPDGTRVEKGDVVMRVAGRTRQLLVAERTALNLACHLSGIATATARWVEALAGSPTRVLDTRKTLPGLRALQKYAVRCGGGVNHRTSLQDMAMVKDNHVIAAGGVLPALEAIRARVPGLPVEVEVTTLDQLDELLALPAPPERILLDNMSDELMAEAVRRTAGRVPLEASGGITLERAARIGATGVDFVSVGALTHSVTVFDIGLDLLPTPRRSSPPLRSPEQRRGDPGLR